MSHGHQDPDTPLPTRRLRFRHLPMSRERAYDVAIAFAQATGMPCQPRLTADGESYDALVPMSYIEGVLLGLGELDPP